MRRFNGQIRKGLTKGASALVLAAVPVAGFALTPEPASAASPPPGCVAANSTQVVCTYEYNGTNGADGSVQTFVVPAKANVATIETWGAQGGGTNGGLGGYVTGTLALTPGSALEVRVGGQPASTTGGYNGGGNGGTNAPGGGGGSDVRVAGADLLHRLVTAGGGGGSGNGFVASTTLEYRGGAGGGFFAGGGALVSGDPALDCNLPPNDSTFCGGAATAWNGGRAGYNKGCPGYSSDSGDVGVGGRGTSCSQNLNGVEVELGGGGGGGGWRGGGGGGGWVAINPNTARRGPGGGGSGWISVPTAVQQEAANVRSGHGKVTITYNPKGVPASGHLVCDVVNATVKASPALTNTPSTKPVKLTFAGTATCNHDDVIGGKAPITELTFTQTWTAATGSTCATIPSGAAQKSQKVQVALKGRNAKNKLFTVATIKTTHDSVRAFSDGFTNRATVPAKSAAFANNEVALYTYAEPLDALAERCAGAGVTTAPLTGLLDIRPGGGG